MEDNGWMQVPDDILFNVFGFLPARSLLNASEVCRRWHRVANDEFLWNDLFYRHWNVNRAVPMTPGAISWQSEYRRLVFHSPVVESQVLSEHTDQVLHVSFSHAGDMFSTASKDGFIKVWNMPYPVGLRCQADLKEHNWKYTQCSQFNKSDTMLLVSGVHPGDSSTLGEIAVFTVQPKFEYVQKVWNKPYDIFGTWFDDSRLLSGDLHWRGHFASCSSLYLSSAVGGPRLLLYKFHNTQASSVRTIIIADINHCETQSLLPNGQTDDDTSASSSDNEEIGLDRQKSRGGDDMAAGDSYGGKTLAGATSASAAVEHKTRICSVCEAEKTSDKLLIFTMGSRTYTPHQVGIKHVLPNLVNETSLKSLGNRTVTVHEHGNRDPDDDDVDHIIEMHGHIIGMNLSPDHRFLYVNCRAWPKNYTIEDPLDPPPIAQEIVMEVIDLKLMTVIANQQFLAHKAFTSNEECFFIFLDVSVPYVASGAENSNGYLWDRQYMVHLATLTHEDVVNCVAFSPTDPETLVTVSDDNTIKIWRSRNRERQLQESYRL